MDDNTTIPQWIAVGRTVLLPKVKDLSSEEEYRPITCLNTSYKLFAGILAKFMKEHAEKNEIWDGNQMGTCQDVLGTVDQLLTDNCIMEEVRTHKRNLAVAYYDYRKAYDMVHHDWMLRVYESDRDTEVSLQSYRATNDEIEDQIGSLRPRQEGC